MRPAREAVEPPHPAEPPTNGREQGGPGGPGGGQGGAAPVRPPAQGPSRPRPERPARPRFDDDIRNAFALTRVLGRVGIGVVHAESGRECLDVLDRDPDVSPVLTAVMMPGMDLSGPPPPSSTWTGADRTEDVPIVIGTGTDACVCRRGPRGRAGQPTACFTSAAIRASTSGVTSVRAKPAAHIVPSSSLAWSLKPRVA